MWGKKLMSIQICYDAMCICPAGHWNEMFSYDYVIILDDDYIHSWDIKTNGLSSLKLTAIHIIK